MDAWLAQSVEHAILDLRAVSSSSTLGGGSILKKKKKHLYVEQMTWGKFLTSLCESPPL